MSPDGGGCPQHSHRAPPVLAVHILFQKHSDALRSLQYPFGHGTGSQGAAGMSAWRRWSRYLTSPWGAPHAHPAPRVHPTPTRRPRPGNNSCNNQLSVHASCFPSDFNHGDFQ